MELVTAVLGDHGQRPQDDYGKDLNLRPHAPQPSSLTTRPDRWVLFSLSKEYLTIFLGETGSRLCVGLVVYGHVFVIDCCGLRHLSDLPPFADTFSDLSLNSGCDCCHGVGKWKTEFLFNSRCNCFLQGMEITNKSCMAVLNKLIQAAIGFMTFSLAVKVQQYGTDLWQEYCKEVNRTLKQVCNKSWLARYHIEALYMVDCEWRKNKAVRLLADQQPHAA
uniref:Uncharacterized protein n=1 Tax=Solanum demissum TaxID=50514 RepID=Q6L3H8_SOLDE|nr:hypothetical protein SDM1_4t00009 [Solanum demissum]ABI34286.1 hypothetical protein SDM1_23t00010 [Solanum demissum]